MNKTPSPLRRFAARRLHVLAAAALAATLAGQIVPHWFFGLFTHFVPHYAATMLLAALFLEGKRRGFWLVCGLVFAAWTLLPLNTVVQRQAAAEKAPGVLWYNVNLDNPAAVTESRRLIEADADIVALAEIDLNDKGWNALRQHYPHGCAHQDDSPFALAVWGKTPLVSCDIRFYGSDETGGFPYIRAEANGQTLYALHPPPPVNAALAQAQKGYLAQVAAEIAAETGDVLVVGDLNATPYSPLFRRFAAAARIEPQTRYLLPTWLPFGLNIDHALTRNRTAEVHALPFTVSDHRPLLVR